MSENDELIRTIVSKQNAFMTPIVGENTELYRRLAPGLESIVRGEVNKNPSDSTDSDQLGPVLKDGNRYSREQILDMDYQEFLNLHRSTEGFPQIISRYIGKVGRSKIVSRSIENLVTINDIRQVPVYCAVQLKAIILRNATDTNNYLQSNYGFSLGTPFSELEDSMDNPLGPELKDGYRLTREEMLNMPANIFIGLHGRELVNQAIKRYFGFILRKVDLGVEEGQPTLAKHLLSVPKDVAVRTLDTRGVAPRERLFKDVANYFGDNYRVEVGTKLA